MENNIAFKTYLDLEKANLFTQRREREFNIAFFPAGFFGLKRFRTMQTTMPYTTSPLQLVCFFVSLKEKIDLRRMDLSHMGDFFIKDNVCCCKNV